MPGFLIDRNAYLFRLRVKETLARLGLDLTAEEALLVFTLHQTTSLRIGELAEITIRDTTTLTRLIEGLERKNCVKREPDPDDRRAVRVRLLAEGKRLFHVFHPELNRLRERIMEGVSEKEQAALLRSLRKIQQNSIAPLPH